MMSTMVSSSPATMSTTTATATTLIVVILSTAIIATTVIVVVVIVVVVVVGVGLRSGALNLVRQSIVAANGAQERGVGTNVNAFARHGCSLIQFLGMIKVFGNRFEKHGICRQCFQMGRIASKSLFKIFLTIYKKVEYKYNNQ